MIVLPAPGSSASTNRSRAWGSMCRYTAVIWCGRPRTPERLTAKFGIMGVGERDPVGLHEVEEVLARHERRTLFDRLDQPVAEILVGEGRLLERSGVGAHAQEVGAGADRLHALQAHGADEMPAQADAPAGKVFKRGWRRIGAHVLA